MGFVAKMLQSLTVEQKEHFNTTLNLTNEREGYSYNMALGRVHTQDAYRALLLATDHQSNR